MANTIAINSKLDGFGMFVSCICAVHCLAMPVAFGVLPVIGASFLVDEMTENLLLLSASMIGIVSLLAGYISHHRRVQPIVIFGIGVLLILAGRFGVDERSPYEVAFSAAGAMHFAMSHFINYRFCKKCCAVREIQS